MPIAIPRGSKRAPRVTAGNANHISAGLAAPPVESTAPASSSGVIPQAAAIQTAGWADRRMKRSATPKPANPTRSGASHPQPSSGARATRPAARIAKHIAR